MGWFRSADPPAPPLPLNPPPPPPPPVEALFGYSAEEITPLASQVGFGSTAGYLAGFALQQFGKLAATAIGTGFIVVQGLSYMGYVDVNWRKVERDYTSYLDLNNDGKVDIHDIAVAYEEAQKVLSFNLPAGASFSAGLLYGMGTKATTAAGATAAAGVVGRLLAGRAVTASAIGAGAVGGPAMLVAVKDYLHVGEQSHAAAPEDALEAFTSSVEREGLVGLRAIEKSLKAHLKSAKGSADRDVIGDKLGVVEGLKKARKAAGRG